jgi:heme A synthase
MPALKRFAAAAWLLLAYTLAVVLWGALVRATLSGDGCGDHWPLCNGVVVPVDASRKTLIELTHRVTSGLCWIWTFVMWFASRRLFVSGHPSRRAAGWGLFFMSTEALVGAGLVLFKMVASNPSTARAAWMSLHLVNTFLLLAALSWLAFSAARPEGVRWIVSGRLKRLLAAAAALVLLVGVSGAIAALGDTLFPAEGLSEGLRQDLSPTAHVFVRLRLWHPLIALLTGVYLTLLAPWLLRQIEHDLARRLSIALMGLVVLQIAAGLLNVALLAPVWLQLVHLLLADAIWITLVLLALSSPRPAVDASLSP